MATKATTTKKEKSTPPPAPVAEETTALVPDAPGGVLAQENYDEFADATEGLNENDLLITRFRIVQGTTRAKKVNKALREGHIYNTLSKKGYEQLVVVPLYEEHLIVERTNDDASKFIGTMPLNDSRARNAMKKNNNQLIGLLSVDRDPPTKLIETRDVHVAILEQDGITFREFGVIQGESTNLLPLKMWKNDRVAACAPVKRGSAIIRPARPPFSLRAVISTDDKDNSSSGKPDSKIYKVVPFGGTGNWEDGFLRVSVPEELDLLRKLAQHRQMVVSGALKVNYREETESGEDETTAENSSFDPEDDGREPVAATGSSTADAVDPETF